MERTAKMYEVFISYASEERRAVVQPIVNRLSSFGLSVWYDDTCLLIGDSLLESINQGLEKSNYGVVVLSQNSFLKHWPRYELSQLSTDKIGRILPVLNGITYKDLNRYAPLIAKKRAVSTADGLDRVCREIIQVVREK